MNNVLSPLLGRVRQAGHGFILMGIGAAMATGFAVWAQVSNTTTPQASTSCALSTAAQTTLNNRIAMIGMTQPDPSKYFTIGGISSCIGLIQNLDLSNLIPDPMGLLTSLAKQAIAIGEQMACTAARQSLADTLNKYNYGATLLNGGGNTAVNMIDASIGKSVGVALTNYGTNYAAPAGSQQVINPLTGITNTLNNTVGGTVSSTASTFTSTAQQTVAPVTSSVTSTASTAVNNVSSGLSSLGSSIFGGK
jgi:hypothetical protein